MRAKRSLSWVLWGLALIGSAMLLSCGSDTVAGGSSETGNSGIGLLRIETFDAPPSREIDHVYLAFEKIEAHNEEAGWVVLSTESRRIDFIALVNGRTLCVVDTALDTGRYDEIRITLGDANSVVVADTSYPLRVPSAVSSGIRLQVPFAVRGAETTSLYVDFDIAASISVHDDEYRMAPSFAAYDAATCGRVSGGVRTVGGQPVANAVVHAIGSESEHGTLTDTAGMYVLAVPAGTYRIDCEADDAGLSDTVYQDVVVRVDQNTNGIDFTFDSFNP